MIKRHIEGLSDPPTLHVGLPGGVRIICGEEDCEAFIAANADHIPGEPYDWSCVSGWVDECWFPPLDDDRDL